MELSGHIEKNRGNYCPEDAEWEEGHNLDPG